MAVMAREEMSGHKAALFFPGLFSELDTHSQVGITTALLQFYLAKASRFAPEKAELLA